MENSKKTWLCNFAVFLNKKTSLQVDLFLKTPNLFNYSSIVEKTFVSPFGMEFMLNVVFNFGEKKENLLGFFCFTPCADLTTPPNKNEFLKILNRAKNENFFLQARVPQDVFLISSIAKDFKIKLYEYGVKTVPCIQFPLAHPDDFWFLENFFNSRSLENVVLVLSSQTTHTLLENFKKVVNDFVEDVTKTIEESLKELPYLAVFLKTSPEMKLSAEFYFLPQKALTTQTVLASKDIKQLLSFINFIKEKNFLFEKIKTKLEKKYPPQFLYPVWINTICHTYLFDFLETVFLTVFKRDTVLFFNSALFYEEFSKELPGERDFFLIYDKKGTAVITNHYLEDYKTSENIVIKKYLAYQNAINKILENF